MAKQIIIELEGGIGAILPDDPVNGRFLLRGTIVKGAPKMAIGRTVEVHMTKAQLEGVVNYGASYLLRSPKCGSTPKEDDDG
jgi:hypothetical protein